MAGPMIVTVWADIDQMKAALGVEGPMVMKKFADNAEQMAAKSMASMTALTIKSQEMLRTYTASLAGMEKGSAEYIATLRLIQAEQRKLGVSSATMGGMMEQSVRKMQSFGRAMTMYVTIPIGIAAAASTKMFIDFQKNMELIHTQAGASQAEVNAQTKNVLAYAAGGTSPLGPTALSQALFHLESLGLRGSAAMSALKVSAQAAGLGMANIEDVATALGGAVTAFYDKASGSTKQYNTVMGTMNAIVGSGNMRLADLTAAFRTGVGPAARDAGLTLKELGAALAVLTDRGMGAQMAATRLRMTLSFLQSPNPTQTSALKDLGIGRLQIANMLQADPNTGFLRAIELIKAGMDSLHDKIRANSDLLNAFGRGRSGAGILTLIGSLTSNISSYQSKLNLIDAQQSKFASDVAAYHKTAAYKISAAWASIQASMIKVGAALAPTAVKLANALKNLANWFTALSPETKKFLGIVLISLAALGPMIKLVGMMTSVGTAAKAMGTAFSIATSSMDAEAVGTASVIDSALITTGIGALVVAIGLMTAYTITHWEQVKHWIIDFGAWLKSHAYALLAVPFIGAIAFLAVEIYKHIQDIKGFFDGLGKFFGTIFTHPIRAIEDAFTSLTNWITDQFKGVVKQIVGLLNAIINAYNKVAGWLTGNIPTLGVSASAQGGINAGTAYGQNWVAAANNQMAGFGQPTWTGGSKTDVFGGGARGGGGYYTGGLQGDTLKSYIISQSQKMGVDPAVALALASTEGGLNGAIGDNGTSFGPWQLHSHALGGALPAGKGAAWAQSKAGINYALHLIYLATMGQGGPAAIAAGVNLFERPLKKLRPGEIRADIANYIKILKDMGVTTDTTTGVPAITDQNNPEFKDLSGVGSSPYGKKPPKKVSGLGLLPVGMQIATDKAYGLATTPEGKAAYVEQLQADLKHLQSMTQSVKVVKEEATVRRAIAAEEKSLSAQSGMGFLGPAQQIKTLQAEMSATTLKGKQAYDAILTTDIKRLDAMTKEKKYKGDIVKITEEEVSLKKKQETLEKSIATEVKKAKETAEGLSEAKLLGLPTTGSTSSTQSWKDTTKSALGQITQEVAAWGGQLDPVTINLLAKFNQILKKGFVRADVKAYITQQISDITSDVQQRLTKKADELKSQFEQIYSAMTGAADKQFQDQTDRVVQSMTRAMDNQVKAMQDAGTKAMNALQVTVNGPNGSFLYGGAITQTPAEQQLAALQKAHDDAARQAQLAADTASGDQKAIAEDQYNIQVAALQDQADAEKAAADAQLQTAQDAYQKQLDAQIQAYQDSQNASIKAYQDQRTLQQNAMDTALSIEETRYENGDEDATTFQSNVAAILTQHGIDAGNLAYAAGTNLVNGLVPGINAAIDLWNQYALAMDAAQKGTTSGHVTVPVIGANPTGSSKTTSALGKAIISAVTSAYGGGTGHIGGLASGGVVTAPLLTMIGEGGSHEAVIPLDRYNFGSGGDVHIHFDGPVFGDMRQVARQLLPPLRDELKKVNRRNVTTGLT